MSINANNIKINSDINSLNINAIKNNNSIKNSSSSSSISITQSNNSIKSQEKKFPLFYNNNNITNSFIKTNNKNKNNIPNIFGFINKNQ